MIQTGSTPSILPNQYQHTSFLRGSIGSEEEQLDNIVSSGKDTVRASHYPLYSLAKRSSIGTDKYKESIGGGDGGGAHPDSISARSSPRTTHSEESSMTATMSFASRAGSATSLSDSKDRLPESSPLKRTRDLDEERRDEQRELSPRKQLRQDDDEDEDTSAKKLPGIAHLDRHMHTPWNNNRHDGEEGYGRSRYSPPSSNSVERRYDADGMLIDRRPLSFDASRRPSYADRFSYASGGGAYSSADRLPSYRSMYKRSDSPAAGYHRDYDHAERTEERAYIDQNPSSLRPEARSTTWPSSPAFRREGGNESSAGPGFTAYDAPYRDYQRDGERSSLPPLHPSHSARGAPLDHRASRSPTTHARSGYEAGPRGLGLATDGSMAGDPYPSYGGNGRGAYYSGGMPRPSSSSLRSLSMPYPYDQQPASGQHRHPYNGSPRQQQYDDSTAPSHHNSIGGPMHVTHVSSPRHHPYAQPGVGGMPASVSAATTGTSTPSGYGTDLPPPSGQHSPGSAPRRRGKLPKPVTDLLKTWLLDHAAHPYPTEDEKRRLCAATGLSISQVSNWFINARRRILVPQGSGHFGVAPSPAAAAAANEGGPGQADLDHRRSPPLHPPPYHPHSDLNQHGPPSHHHQQYYQASSSSLQHHPYQHHRDSHHGHHTYASHPPPPGVASSAGGVGRHPGGLPLGPPPLPSHHAHSGSYSREAHGMHGEHVGYRSGGADHKQTRSPVLERYPRSAGHSPIMSRRRDSP